MKNIIIILFLTVFFNKLYGQPTSETIDLNEGSFLICNIFKHKKNTLYIDDWLSNKKNPRKKLYVLEGIKKDKKKSI